MTELPPLFIVLLTMTIFWIAPSSCVFHTYPGRAFRAVSPMPRFWSLSPGRCKLTCLESSRCVAANLVVVPGQGLSCQLLDMAPATLEQTEQDKDAVLYVSQVMNLAQLSGVRCEASSVYNPDHVCENAFDGSDRPPPATSEWASAGEGHGAWLMVHFPRVVQIETVILWSRCAMCDQFNILNIEASPSSAVSVHRVCNGNSVSSDCTGVEPDKFLTSLDASLYLKVTGFNPCSSACNVGFREIQLIGQFALNL